MNGASLRIFGGIIVAFGLAACARAQTFEGEVVDKLTKAPVAGAHLSLHHPLNSPAAITNSAGRFRLDLPQQACCAVTLSRAGYLQRMNLYLDDRPGKMASPVRIEMTPQAVISGKIVDEDGFPVEGAQVRVFKLANLNGQRRLRAVETGSASASNDLGEYRIPGLGAGRYYVRVSSVGDADNWHPSYLPQFYPSAATVEESTAIELKTGEQRADLHFRLVRREGASVSGRVDLPAGLTDTRGVSVWLRNEDDVYANSYVTGQVQSDGSFQILHVAPGNFTLRVVSFSPNGGMTATLGSQPLVVGTSSVGGLTIATRIPEPRDVTGRIELATGVTPVPDKIALRMSDGAVRSAPIASDGTFTIQAVPPGHYSLHAMMPLQPRRMGEAPITLRIGGREVLNRMLELDGAPVEPLIVHVNSYAPGSARVSFRLVDASGQPVAGGQILMQGTVKEHRQVFPVMVTGESLANSLEPDDYRIYAADESAGGSDFDDPDFLAAHETGSSPVHIVEGNNPLLQVTLRAQ